MMRLFNSLASRLTLWYAGIFVVFFSAAFLFFYFFIDAILDQRLDEDLEEDIVEFRLLWESEGLTGVKTELQREVMSEDPREGFFRLLDVDGNEIFSSDMSYWRGLELSNEQTLNQLSGGSDPILNTVRRVGDEHDTRTVHGSIGSGTTLQIGNSMGDNKEFMGLLFNIFATTFCAVMVLAGLVGWFMARQALRGVEEVSRAAVDVANGTLNRRVSVKAKGTEIERLVTTFNVMVDRIRGLISGMREMTDNIAHDMRSPLARMRANSELALSGAKTIDDYKTSAADTLEECDRLLQMINTTLDVAEAEVGVAELTKDDVDISSVVGDACELFEPIAEDKGIKLSLKLDANCHVHGNTQFLQRMFANILDNALKYTPSKGHVDVEISSDNTVVSISVRDTGIGISESDQSHIYERFYRCDQSRSKPGFGLGLSLARAVARAHGGDLSLLSNLGRGSLFTVTLPVIRS
jgi:heavy metal sensor kinase